jgi:hypothetical protein
MIGQDGSDSKMIGFRHYDCSLIPSRGSYFIFAVMLVTFRTFQPYSLVTHQSLHTNMSCRNGAKPYLYLQIKNIVSYLF